MQPLVLAIEPDLRQAAIVKRIVREKVQADVTVVDSRDAALEAIRTAMPDVLLLSVLLSPRDEAELIAHLRTLEHAQHLQTQTIPQLSSTILGEEKPARGLLSAFRRRKESASSSPSGCDPELFAEEVRTYLKRASEKKRELREALALGGVPSAGPASRSVADPARSDHSVSPTEPATSSWASPFEWRPSGTKPAGPASDRHAAAAQPSFPAHESALEEPLPSVVTSEFSAAVHESSIVMPESSIVMPESSIVMPESSIVMPESSIVMPEAGVAASGPAMVNAESFTDVDPLAGVARASAIASPESARADFEFRTPLAAGEPAVEAAALSVANVEAEIPDQDAPVVNLAPVAATEAAPELEPARTEPVLSIRRRRPPLVIRHPRGWWYVEGKGDAAARDPQSELREVLANLSVPATVAAVRYAEGCRIRRVRLTAA